MAVRKIVKIENAILQKKCEKITCITEKEITLLQDLQDTLDSTQGVGIAAPQIGILQRAIVVKWEEQKYLICNPTIIQKSGRQTYYEGCLSVDTQNDFIYGKVERSYQIVIQGINEKREEVTIEAEGILAVVFQHEIDHLEGKIYLESIIGEPVHFATQEERQKWKAITKVHEIIEK